MASFFNLTLDTTAPLGVTLKINNGVQYTSSTSATLAIGTTDTPTTGYQMKIWGTSAAANEATASWENYATTKSVTLATGDGTKTISIKIRDDVLNESSAVTASIILDTKVPVVTITGPDVTRISKKTSADECNFSFKVDKDFVEYKVKVVPAESSLENAGVLIPSTNGSSNMAGVDDFVSASGIICVIKAADLAVASSADGTKIIKVFVKDKAGTWNGV